MEPTTMQPRGAGSAMMHGSQMGDMGGMMGGSMMDSCPCMQMHQAMTSGPMAWTMAIVMALFAIAAIAALVSLSVFLIRRSRLAVVR